MNYQRNIITIYLLRLCLGGCPIFLLPSKKCCLICAMLNPPMKLDLVPPPFPLLFALGNVDSQIVSILSAFCR